jgi:3-methyladenine DNA glycosylase AlkD
MAPSMNKDSLAQLAAEIGAKLRGLRKRTAANVRAVRREFSKRLLRADKETVLSLALLLMDQRGFEHRFVGYELVSHHGDALASLRAKHLKQLGRGLDSWFAVDAFACYLAGPAWREKQVPDSLIHGWAKSKDRWWRRTALACTVPLNNKTRGAMAMRPGRCPYAFCSWLIATTWWSRRCPGRCASWPSAIRLQSVNS